MQEYVFARNPYIHVCVYLCAYWREYAFVFVCTSPLRYPYRPFLPLWYQARDPSSEYSIYIIYKNKLIDRSLFTCACIRVCAGREYAYVYVFTSPLRYPYSPFLPLWYQARDPSSECSIYIIYKNILIDRSLYTCACILLCAGTESAYVYADAFPLRCPYRPLPPCGTRRGLSSECSIYIIHINT